MQDTIQSRRVLATFGFLSPSHWPGTTPHAQVNPIAYAALKKAGFQETIWQYVFRGQCGGLILPCDGGRLELHVRFYRDGTVDAELEVGRRYVGHFFYPRHRAKSRVLAVVQPHITAEEFRVLQRLLKADPDDAGSLEGRVGADVSYTAVYGCGTLAALLMSVLGWLPAWSLIFLLFVGIAMKHTLPKPD